MARTPKWSYKEYRKKDGYRIFGNKQDKEFDIQPDIRSICTLMISFDVTKILCSCWRDYDVGEGNRGKGKDNILLLVSSKP